MTSEKEGPNPVGIELKADRYFTCPNGCLDKFYVEHLIQKFVSGSSSLDRNGRTHAGPWYCETCGQGWDVDVSADGRVDVIPTRCDVKRMKHCWVILEIPPQPLPIRFKVHGRYWADALNEQEIEYKRYFYEEHTCTTNWLHSVEEVSIGDDNDPHGLARFVSAYDVDGVAESPSDVKTTALPGYVESSESLPRLEGQAV